MREPQPSDGPEYHADHQFWLETKPCDRCGYARGSFACKICHVQINTGAAKAAND